MTWFGRAYWPQPGSRVGRRETSGGEERLPRAVFILATCEVEVAGLAGLEARPCDSIRQARWAMVPCHRWESDVLASLALHRPLHQRIEERTWDFRRRARVVEHPSNST
jgi:hypothetical protein